MTHDPKEIRLRRPNAAYPAWLPIDPPSWRLVGPDGTMLRDSDGYCLRFTTDHDALAWLTAHSIPLLTPHIKR